MRDIPAFSWSFNDAECLNMDWQGTVRRVAWVKAPRCGVKFTPRSQCPFVRGHDLPCIEASDDMLADGVALAVVADWWNVP